MISLDPVDMRTGWQIGLRSRLPYAHPDADAGSGSAGTSSDIRYPTSVIARGRRCAFAPGLARREDEPDANLRAPPEPVRGSGLPEMRRSRGEAGRPAGSAAAGRRLPRPRDPRGARPRRDGRGVQGAEGPARRRAEGLPAGEGGRSRLREPVPAQDARARGARPSEHRPDPRVGQGRRGPLLHDGARRRRVAPAAR